MELIELLFKGVALIPRFLPPSKPPIIDYMSLRGAMPPLQFPSGPTSTLRLTSATLEPAQIQSIQLERAEPTAPQLTEKGVTTTREVSTACLSCTRSHLSTVAGALSEGLRFARSGGLTNPDVIQRLGLAEQEINMLERIDLAPENVAKLPPLEKRLANEYLPKIRTLRQNLGDISSVDEMEKTAAEASIMAQEFRLRHLQLKGVDLNPVLQLAKKVQSGEITMEDAKAQLRAILPEEE